MNQSPPHAGLRQGGKFLLEILYNAVVIIALVVLIRTFIASPFRVIGTSMADTLHNNEFILINKIGYLVGEPERGDPIVFLPPVTGRTPYKFEQAMKSDSKGQFEVDLEGLQGTERSPYCKKGLAQILWLCTLKTNEGDWIYFLKTGGESNVPESEWRQAEKRQIIASEISSGTLAFKGEPNSDYLLRIYSSTGDEYFVKRIIGLPGDEVKIKDGEVFLKKPGEKDFSLISEAYLNSENKGHTYLPSKVGSQSLVVPPDQYFVMGDNRNHSNDSRSWFSPLNENFTPFVKESQISGKVMVVLWPPWHLRLIPGYSL